MRLPLLQQMVSGSELDKEEEIEKQMHKTTPPVGSPKTLKPKKANLTSTQQHANSSSIFGNHRHTHYFKICKIRPQLNSLLESMIALKRKLD
jgi:hypothetical protein